MITQHTFSKVVYSIFLTAFVWSASIVPVFAQCVDDFGMPIACQGYKGLVYTLIGFFDGIIPIIIGLAILFFLWNVVGYIRAAGDEKKHTDARRGMLWGVFAIFFMVSMWGFVNITLGIFGSFLGDNNPIEGSIIVE